MRDILNGATYGTLALSRNNTPYSLPINFVYLNNSFYFHGSKKGKKVDILKSNNKASFSVVNEASLIPSYFSSDKGLACPATQFFSSLIAEGVIEFIDNYQEKTDALQALMQKLQTEGGYKELNSSEYKKAIESTLVYKLVVKNLTIKDKYGQKLPKERIKMVLSNLQKRGTKIDEFTINKIKEFRDDI